MESHDVWFTDDPREFLDRAGEHLGQRPVEATIVTTTAHRLAAVGDGGLPHRWFAVVSDPAGEVAGVAMRTAPFAPYPPYLLDMDDAAATALARAVLARGEVVAGATGLRPAVDVFASTLAAAGGGEPAVHLHHRLFELGTLVAPRVVPGRLRPARRDEAGLVLEWIHRFLRDADEQAGRTGGFGDHDHFTTADVERKLDEGVLWFWEDGSGRVVHLTGANPPSFGVVRIGPVFTPADERGRGWAAAAVAAVSQLLRDRGDRVILFTDQANPVSNALYLALGFEPVVDTAELRIVAPS